MPHVYRIGFTELAASNGGEDHSQGSKRVNIILVHGLGGHPVETWASSRPAGEERAVGASSRSQHIKSFFKSTAPPAESSSAQQSTGPQAQQVFWPQDYLAKDIPQARVWTYGYNADVTGSLFQASNMNSVTGHGQDLKVRLEREIGNEDPIMFVAHSLGGIVVKEALFKSEACRKRTRLVIFLGTPHRGSTLVQWGEIASNLARMALHDSNKKIVEALEVDSEVLNGINERFVKIVSEQSISIHSFQEARGISGMKGLHHKVVDDYSSKLGLSDTVETPESIDANHVQMVKCTDRLDESYRAIIGVLKLSLKGASPSADIPIRSVMRTQQEEASSAEHETDTPGATTSYYLIPPRNRRFIGRTKKMKELEEKLIISDDCQKLALVGLGGIGKSQIALELAYTVKERAPEYSIFWVSAVSGESFQQAYEAIATTCSVPLNPTEEDPRESVQRYLNSSSAGKWLLIVDNSDDEEVLFETSGSRKGVTDYLAESENGLTLFTTRYREMAVSLAGSKVVEIQEMGNEEAEIFLTESLNQKELLEDRTVTSELLNELTYLPLAIAQAAAYLNTTLISIRDYLSLLRDTEEEAISLLSREFRDHTSYKNSKISTAATWLVSFDQIRRSDPYAADLLSFMSCIENKAIPRSMLPSVKPAEKMVHAIGTLRAYAFVTKRDEDDIYDMHRLVHLATKVWLREGGTTEELNEEVAAHLAEIFPSPDWSNRYIWREYFPHALQFLRHTKALDSFSRNKLCMAVGRCLRVDGRVGEAIVWLQECFLGRQKHFAEDHPSRLTSQHVLAMAYSVNGQVDKAIKLLKHVIAIREKVLKEDHPNRLASQHELARAYLNNRQVDEAVKLLKHVVAIREMVLKEDHPDRLTSQHELARAYRDNGQVEKAIKLLENVVAIKGKVLKEDHPSRLVSQHELAKAYQVNRQVKKAVELFKHIVTIKTVLKEDHPDRLVSQHELAIAYWDNGQTKEAVELLEYVVAIRKRVLKKDHPSRLASERSLSYMYAKHRPDGDDQAESDAS